MTADNRASFGRQVLRRKVNDRLLTAGEGVDVVDVFCECGGRMCRSQVRVAIDLYERVVASGCLFLVASGHEDSRTEQAVRRYEHFLVVDRGPERASAA